MDYFGWSNALNASGSILAVGAMGYNAGAFVGRVYVYKANSYLNTWVLDASLNSPTATIDRFGNALALNANGLVLAVGAFTYATSTDGRVYIYNYINNAWIQNTTINSLSYIPTSYSIKTSYFGNSLSLNGAGTLLAIGGFGNNTGTGFVSIWKSADTFTWTKAMDLSNNNPSADDLSNFGSQVAFDLCGNVLVVSAPRVSVGTLTDNGRIYVYNAVNNNWANGFNFASPGPTQLSIDASGTYLGLSGLAINAAGTIIAAGAPRYNTNVGRVYTFTYNNPVNVLATRTCNALAVNTKIWVAGGVSPSTNPLAYSLDGLSWLTSNNGTGSFPFSSGICNAIAWNGGKFVAGGTGSNPLAYSYDGQIWYQSANGGSIFTQQCNGLTWNGMYWLAAGQGTNTLAYSPDGITWLGISNTLFSSNVGKAICSRRVITGTSGGGAGGGGNVTQQQLATLTSTILNNALGYSQTWQNMTSLRANNATYYNTTGRPIMVSAYAGASTNVGLQVIVNNNVISYQFSNANIIAAVSGIVPPNASYRVYLFSDTALTLNYWELR